MSGGAGVLMADAAEEERARTDPARRGVAEGGASRWVPFAAPRNPVDVTAQALNDPIDPRQIASTSCSARRNFPAMVGFFTTWASSPQMAEPLFKAVSGAAARYPDRYFALSAIATPEMQRRYEEAGVGLFEDPWRAVESIAAAVRCRRAARRHAAAGPAGAARTCRRCRRAASPSTRRSASWPRPASRSSTSGSSTNAGRGRRVAAADRRAAGAEDRLGRHPAQNRDGRRHARRPGGRGRRRLSTA